MKDVKGYEGLYAIMEDGKVWSYARPRKNGNRPLRQYGGKFLSPYKIAAGYLAINLVSALGVRSNGRRGELIHRLIAIAYIENPLNLPCINHKNGIKTDNRVENLEWCTSQDNRRHALRVLRVSTKLSFELAQTIRKEYSLGGTSHRALAKKYGVRHGIIGAIIRKTSWREE